MSLSDNINFIQHIEHYIGENQILGLDDTANRALKELIAKFDNGQADTQVYRNFFNVTPSSIAEDVVSDDLVQYDFDTNKWIKSIDTVWGVIDVELAIVQVFGVYTMKNETSLIPGSKYYLDGYNHGQYTTSGVSGIVFGDALANDTILILALSGTTSNPTIFTDAPIISGASDIVEQIPTDFIIDNYNATFTYNITPTNGTATRVGDTITFTSNNVLSATSSNFRVNAQNILADEGVSTDTTKTFTIHAVEEDSTDTVGTSDGVLLYTGVTMDNVYFPTPINGSVIANVCTATANSAVFETISETQDVLDADFISVQNIKISQNGIDVLSTSDVSECIIDAELNLGDKVLLTDGITFVFYTLVDSTINVFQTTFTHNQAFVPIKCFIDYENSLEVSLDDGVTYFNTNKTSWSLSGNVITEHFEDVNDATVGNRDVRFKLTIAKDTGTVKLIQGNLKKRI